MTTFSLQDMNLKVIPAASSSEHDFDFLAGSWFIHNRKLNERLCYCQDWTEFKAQGTLRQILHGFGNIDDFVTEFEGKLFEGMSLRIFNPLTKVVGHLLVRYKPIHIG